MVSRNASREAFIPFLMESCPSEGPTVVCWRGERARLEDDFQEFGLLDALHPGDLGIAPRDFILDDRCRKNRVVHEDRDLFLDVRPGDPCPVSCALVVHLHGDNGRAVLGINIGARFNNNAAVQFRPFIEGVEGEIVLTLGHECRFGRPREAHIAGYVLLDFFLSEDLHHPGPVIFSCVQFTVPGLPLLLVWSGEIEERVFNFCLFFRLEVVLR